MMEYKVASDYNARVFFEGFGEFERRLQVTPAIAGWSNLSFRVYTFRQGQVLDGESASDEMVMVLLSGAMTLQAAGQTWELDGRPTVFDGRPHLLYLAPGNTYHLEIHRDCDVAYGRAPAEGKLKSRLIRPAEIQIETRDDGAGVYQLNHLLDPGDAEKLLCAEIVAPGNCWVPYPPAATSLEAVRYYRFESAHAWGLQRLYNDDCSLDESFAVFDGDAVILRNGYQTIATPPHGRTFCLNFLAGPNPQWTVRPDLKVSRS